MSSTMEEEQHGRGGTATRCLMIRALIPIITTRMARLESGCTVTPRVLIQFQQILGSIPFTFTRTLTLGLEASASIMSLPMARFIRNGASWEIRQAGK